MGFYIGNATFGYFILRHIAYVYFTIRHITYIYFNLRRCLRSFHIRTTVLFTVNLTRRLELLRIRPNEYTLP